MWYYAPIMISSCFCIGDDIKSRSLESAVRINDSSSEILVQIEKLGGKILKDSNGDVIEINLDHCDIDDSFLERIGRFNRLRKIDLRSTKVGGPGLKYLKRIETLKYINLNSTLVKDEGLNYLRDNRTIETLLLQGCPITDAAFARIKTMQNLKRLDCLNCNRITDKSLETIGKIKELTDLSLALTCITDDALKNLCSLKKLKRLDLLMIRDLSDAGLKHISKLRQLEWLRLGGNDRITDAGVPELLRLNNLRVLDIRGTKITQSGVTKLKANLRARLLADEQIQKTNPKGYRASKDKQEV